MPTCGICKTSQDVAHVRNNYMRRNAGNPHCGSQLSFPLVQESDDSQPTVLANPTSSKYCVALSLKGKQCRNIARKGGYCHIHLRKES